MMIYSEIVESSRAADAATRCLLGVTSAAAAGTADAADAVDADENSWHWPISVRQRRVGSKNFDIPVVLLLYSCVIQ